MPNDDEAFVSSLFTAAGLAPPPEELPLFVAMYPLLRQKADRIYELELEDEG